MQSTSYPILRDIVLVGGGHSHVGVLKHFGMHPEPGVRLTVICTDVHTPYSGMLPGYIAGHYSYDDVHIDLSRLAVFAGARLYRDAVTGIDREAGKVLCGNRPPVAYDLVSVNTGSTPALAGVLGAAGLVVPVKPIHPFNQRWLALLQRVRRHSMGALRIAVVGGGAGGVELLLALPYRLRAEMQALGRNPDLLEFHLFSADDVVMRTHNAGVQRRFSSVLVSRGVQLHLGSPVVEVKVGELHCASGEVFPVDETMWVTHARGAPWLQTTGLALDAQGCVVVNDHLQSITDPRVFAAGDVASMQNYPLEKAGVFAVRMGRPLADNLRAQVRGQALRAYRPQSRWLALISTGDRNAVASRGALGFAGAWVWRWKDHIDRGFMRKFAEFPAMPAQVTAPHATQLALQDGEALQAIAATAMRCGGCGAKVGANVLTRALASLPVLANADVLLGLNAPDDAAVVRVPSGKALVHSVDFFRAFVDDPYVFGKIAANHALGDIFAMGAQPHTATAIATLPPGLESKVEDLLFQMMRGAVEVLNDAGCTLVGGHTGEGAELALGFAVNGLIDDTPDAALRKGGMQVGDVLILTKPLGTGALFAAHARMAAKGRWISAALDFMLQSSRSAAQCLRDHGATACTDVTGFGLLGHLVEMTHASGVDAELTLSAMPLLDGAMDTVAAGITSSLQPANVRLRRVLRNAQDFAADPRYALLFDPQTAGGLLASVPTAQAPVCLQRLHALGYRHAALIGRVTAGTGSQEAVTLL